MRITNRDRLVLEEVCLHQVLSRNQLLALGYFPSVGRANSRLGGLVASGLLGRVKLDPGLETRQSLYFATPASAPWVEPRVAALLAERRFTPQFVSHALMVADVRIALVRLGLSHWRHEAQVRHCYEFGGHLRDLRPDGAVLVKGTPLFVEADRSFASSSKMRLKLTEYGVYARSGMLRRTYGTDEAQILVATTGKTRAMRLKQLGGGDLLLTTLPRLQTASSLAEAIV